MNSFSRFLPTRGTPCLRQRRPKAHHPSRDRRTTSVRDLRAGAASPGLLGTGVLASICTVFCLHEVSIWVSGGVACGGFSCHAVVAHGQSYHRLYTKKHSRCKLQDPMSLLPVLMKGIAGNRWCQLRLQWTAGRQTRQMPAVVGAEIA